MLRAVDQYAAATTESPRTYARIVMSDKAPESKIGDDNLRLLRNLEQRNVVEIRRIRRELFTGGGYRAMMMENSDAMVAIGGGKGTYTVGNGMLELGKPVLPLDLQLGSSADDAMGRWRCSGRWQRHTHRFFPNTHQGVTNRVDLLSLERGINDPGTVAQVAVEMLARELEATEQAEQAAGVKGKLKAVWQGRKELSVVMTLIKIFESVRGALPFV